MPLDSAIISRIMPDLDTSSHARSPRKRVFAFLEPAMPELTHAGMRCNLEWDRDTEHWWGQIDGTEVRITAGHYPDACDLFRQTVEVLTDTARGPDADPP